MRSTLRRRSPAAHSTLRLPSSPRRDSMFRRLPDAETGRRAVVVTIDGAAVCCFDSDTVAAALLAAGCIDFRSTPVIGSRRGPYCMIGACFDCLVSIDGAPNRQGCMTRVRDGMRIERQLGAPPLPDVE